MTAGDVDGRPTLAELQRDEAEDCTCYWTDPSTWTRYGDAVEPGSQMEPNPECPVHFPATAHYLACHWVEVKP